jgi:3-deoxy-D-manno-octulosonic-acid transferase
MIYNILLFLSLPFVIPVFLLVAAFKPRYRVGLSERLGFWSFPKGDVKSSTKYSPALWIHAASVGEVEAVWPLVEKLIERFPSCRFIFTTLTITGRALLEQRISTRQNKSIKAVARLFPVELPGLSDRILGKLRPDLILIVETEIWPNFIAAAHRKTIPVIIVNGRISPRAFSRYRILRWMLRSMLLSINSFLMQSQNDADRIIKLGVPPYRVTVPGNLKLDQQIEPLSDAERNSLKTRWGWNQTDSIWVAGSTHAGEEEQILSVFLSMKKDHPAFRLILAPRHLERIHDIENLLLRTRLPFSLFSDISTKHNVQNVASKKEPAIDIVLLNTMGHLRKLYSLADIVFVGGSLTPVGGHNLIEAALLEKPVLYGPYIQNVQAMADLLEQHGGGIRVLDQRILGQKIRMLLGDTGFRTSMGKLGRQSVLECKGATQKTIGAITNLLESAKLKSIPRFDRGTWIRRWVEHTLWSSGSLGLTLFVAVCLRGIAVLYNGFQRVRESSYQAGVIHPRRLSRPVISVGNLTVGGAGKTPTVISICRLLAKAGIRPAVLSRGYGGNNRNAVLEVSDGDQIKWPANVVGDEPVLLARKLPGVPVFIGTDRTKAGLAAITAYRPDVLVLDDGFQHRQIERDLDLVLIHTTYPFGNGYVLPGGPLREPISHLKRADMLLLTHVESPESIQGLLNYLHGICVTQPIFLSQHRLGQCVPLSTDEGRLACEPELLRERRVLIVAGIAKPEAFIQSIAQTGLNIVGSWILPDHSMFTTEEVLLIERQAKGLGAEAILTTEKDAIRLELLGMRFNKWWAVGVEISLYEPKTWEDLILKVL